MILEEYDEAKTREYLRKEAMEMGREEGLEEGIKIGRESINSLYQRLLSEDRLEDLKRAVTDAAYCQELLKEYGL